MQPAKNYVVVIDPPAAADHDENRQRVDPMHDPHRQRMQLPLERPVIDGRRSSMAIQYSVISDFPEMEGPPSQEKQKTRRSRQRVVVTDSL